MVGGNKGIAQGKYKQQLNNKNRLKHKIEKSTKNLTSGVRNGAKWKKEKLAKTITTKVPQKKKPEIQTLTQ